MPKDIVGYLLVIVFIAMSAYFLPLDKIREIERFIERIFIPATSADMEPAAFVQPTVPLTGHEEGLTTLGGSNPLNLDF